MIKIDSLVDPCNLWSVVALLEVTGVADMLLLYVLLLAVHRERGGGLGKVKGFWL